MDALKTIKIGLISDTHTYLDDRICHHLSQCDEIWHAGDFGDYKTVENLRKIAPLKGVYGNIDGHDIRSEFPLDLKFQSGGLKVWMTHIGGRPGAYNREVIKRMGFAKPDLFICGHSHILLVKRDPTKKWLYLNPGAAGRYGFHQKRTLLTFEIQSARPVNMQLIELGPRSSK
jgi:uncharacterized protein